MSTFTSSFAPHIEAMLEWRTSLGHSLRDMRNAMTGFDRFCASRHPSETVLTRAGIEHVAHDGKSFHALRRTAGTRLIESGAGLPLAAQILGHARIDSSRRYFALASEQIRQCCLPLADFACAKEGLR